jgi:N-methylhydantoinase B
MSFPIRILRYAVSDDGGGAGRRRGGTGVLREVRLDHDATVTLTAERAKFGPYGLFGGLAAPKAEFWARLPNGTQRVLNSKIALLHFPKGTAVQFRCASGGGYGPPREREIERIQTDLDDGSAWTPRASYMASRSSTSPIAPRARRWQRGVPSTMAALAPQDLPGHNDRGSPLKASPWR